MFLTFLGLAKLFSKVVYPLTTVSDGACHIPVTTCQTDKNFYQIDGYETLLVVLMATWRPFIIFVGTPFPNLHPSALSYFFQSWPILSQCCLTSHSVLSCLVSTPRSLLKLLQPRSVGKPDQPASACIPTHLAHNVPLAFTFLTPHPLSAGCLLWSKQLPLLFSKN